MIDELKHRAAAISDLGLIRFRGHVPKGGCSTTSDGGTRRLAKSVQPRLNAKLPRRCGRCHRGREERAYKDLETSHNTRDQHRPHAFVFAGRR